MTSFLFFVLIPHGRTLNFTTDYVESGCTSISVIFSFVCWFVGIFYFYSLLQSLILYITGIFCVLYLTLFALV